MSDARGSRAHAGGDAPPPLRAALGGGAAAFAAVIARRMRRTAVRAASVARVWPRAPRAAARHRAPAGVTFAPVLRITMPGGARADTTRRPASRAIDARVPPVARALAASAAAPRASLSIVAPQVMATLARMVAQRARGEDAPSGSRARGPLFALAAVQASARHIPRAVRPVARVHRARASAIALEEAVIPARRTPLPTAEPLPAQEISPAEVSRLTEHVLRTMERRISAFRERQGRS